MKKTLAFALVVAAVPAAQASLTTVALSSFPGNTAPYASTPGDSLTQPLAGVTIDNRTSGEEDIINFTWAVNADRFDIGYTDFALRIRGSYIAPELYDEFGDPSTVIQIGGSVKSFDDQGPFTPIASKTIPYRELPFAATQTPFDVTINWSNPYAVKDGRVEVEGYFFVPKGALLTLEELDLTSPVPEPASMIALGLGGLALLRRRRKA
ncbi:PEP-CTERM sorting domain-containing protein [bacterium]|nr:MAG: PEP-CTERM sorting domain-containing protein [bacterium]